jgi:hypothetical protein
MSIEWRLEQVDVPTHWLAQMRCPHHVSLAAVWLGEGVAPDEARLHDEVLQNHLRVTGCACAETPVAGGVAHMASDQPMPEVGQSVEWDVIENYPPFTPGQLARVDGLGDLVVLGVNASSLGRLTLRNDGASGNQPPGTVAFAGTLITAEDASPSRRRR